MALRGWGGVVCEMLGRISGTSWRWRRCSALGDALSSTFPCTFPRPLSIPVRVLWSPLVDILSPSHRDRRVIRSRKVAASRSWRVKCLAEQHLEGSQTGKVMEQRNSRRRRCNRFGDTITGALPSDALLKGAVVAAAQVRPPAPSFELPLSKAPRSRDKQDSSNALHFASTPPPPPKPAPQQ